MRRVVEALAACGCLAAAACVSNTAPGNDREATLDGAAEPAEVASAEAALAGVSPGLLQPEIMTAADLSVVGDSTGDCVFRMTRVGLPVFVHDRAGSAAGYVKLNDRLIRLDPAGEGWYMAGGVRVLLRSPGREADAELHPAEFILMLPGTEHELGYRGFEECGLGTGTGA